MPNLDDILPLLISRQKQQQAEDASRALPGVMGQAAGRVLAPNLTDMLTNPPPKPAQPPSDPNYVGKIPSQDPMDPRMPAAMRDIGMLGAGGVAGRVAAPLAEGAVGLANRAAPVASSSGDALKAITGGMALSPPTPAGAATRLDPERRQQLEMERRQAEQRRQDEAARSQQGIEAEAARVRAQTEAQIQADAAREQAKRDAATRERQQPFREKYSTAAQMLPFAGLGLSTVIPALKGALWNRPEMQKFVNKWEGVGNAASDALAGRAKGPAKLATEKLAEFEGKWPGIEKRYTPGMGQNAVMGGLAGEMTAIPTEYDAVNQDRNSPSKPGLEDWLTTLGRSGVAATGGLLGSKFGASLPTKVAPYVGGRGIINAYNAKYPSTRKQPPIEVK